MEEPKKELIKGIADLFEDYEETYVPGEWESFVKDKQKKRVLFPLWMKVAALLFLVASVLLFNWNNFMPKAPQKELTFQKPKSPQTPAQDKTLTQDKTPAASPASPLAAVPHPAARGNALATSVNPGNATAFPHKINNIRSANSNQKADDQLMAAKKQFYAAEKLDPLSVMPLKHAATADTVRQEHKHQQIAQTAIAAIPAAVKKDSIAHAKNKMSTIEFLTAESKAGTGAMKRKETGSKWDFGLAVIPSATSTSTNVGAAVTTAYRISSKFSLSSGISMVQLEGGKNLAAATMGPIQSFARNLSSQQLVSVDAHIRAIDIPIGIVYNVNKHYYTSAGISYFNVLSDKRNNTVVQVNQVNQMSINQLTGAASSYKALVSQEVSEPVTESPLQGNGYLGFFNFSIGRKQHVFNHYDILIEPFVKLPIGKLSDEDLKLMNSGIKFQLAF